MERGCPLNAIDLLQKAEDWIAAARPERALPLFSKILKKSNDPFFEADVLQMRADALRVLSRFEDALKDYWEAHRLYRRCGVLSERLRTLLGASACLRVLSRYGEAAKMWRSVAPLLPKPKQSFDPTSSEFLMEIALVRRGLGEMTEAKRLLTSAILSLEGEKDPEALQHAWWALAGVERFSGCYDRALSAFHKAERLALRNRDAGAQAYAWCGMGGCLRILGKGEESLRFYRRAHDHFQKVEDRFGTAYGLCGMANALRTYGDPEKTIALYRESSALYDKVGDVGSRAFALWGLGGSHRRLGRFKESMAYYRESHRDFKKVGDTRGLLMALLGFGRSLGETGDPASGRVHLDRALALAIKEKHPYEAALARLERARLEGRPLPTGLLKPFGVTSSVVQKWKDIP